MFSWSGLLNVYRWHGDEALINQHIFKVVCADYPQWFVHFHLQEAMPFFQGIAADKATTMGHIKRGQLQPVEARSAAETRIQRTAKQVQPLYDLMHQAERESITLAAIRDALLPKLLAGEIRVG